MLFRARPMLTCLVGAHVEISVGQFSLFFRIVHFYFLCLYVRIRLVLDFFINRGLTRTMADIRKFPKEKNSVLRLHSSQQFEDSRIS
jgi:hypothetical protein